MRPIKSDYRRLFWEPNAGEPNLAVIDGPIHTAWDLGHGSNMAIWCFQVGDEGLRIIDFISETGWFFNDYIADLNRLGYNGDDYVPHDIAAASLETGRTRVETLAKAGRKPMPVPLGKVEDRIHAAQLMLPLLFAQVASVAPSG